jgi:ABC-type molybdate transport system substrate-binding protein
VEAEVSAERNQGWRRVAAGALWAGAALAVVAVVWPGLRERKDRGAEPLLVYCAAGLKAPVEEIAARYRAECGVEVSLQYGGSGTLLAQLGVSRQGDLLLAADQGTAEDARRRGLVAEGLAMVEQRPVLAVRRGNPKGLRSAGDLLRPGLKFALANPEAASISRVTRALLGRETWESWVTAAAVMKPTVTELAADVQLGTVDAAVVWDSTVAQFEDLEAVELSELSGHAEPASALVLASCAVPRRALHFARYLAAPDRGGEAFSSRGFRPAGGDPWTDRPDLVLYSGGVNRLAIEGLVQQFAEREGAEITTVYNGCGILCAAMKAMDAGTDEKYPDAYYACDVCFVPPVAEQFPEAVLLTETEIVIGVPAGNPQGLRTLADLARPGLRVGICNAEQSTLGYLTAAMLRQSGVGAAVRRNVVVEVPTADFLVNQMRAGSLDAVVVYRVNLHGGDGSFETVDLDPEMARAVQPFAVRSGSPRARLAERLLAFLQRHPEAFQGAGFIWKGGTERVSSGELALPAWLQEGR